MKTLKLTERQRLQLFHGKEVKTKQQGNVLYVETSSEGIIIKDMSGSEVKNYQVSDEDKEFIGFASGYYHLGWYVPNI